MGCLPRDTQLPCWKPKPSQAEWSHSEVCMEWKQWPQLTLSSNSCMWMNDPSHESTHSFSVFQLRPQTDIWEQRQAFLDPQKPWKNKIIIYLNQCVLGWSVIQYSNWNTAPFLRVLFICSYLFVAHFLVCYLENCGILLTSDLHNYPCSYGVNILISPLAICLPTCPRGKFFFHASTLFTERAFPKKLSLKLLGWFRYFSGIP